MSVAHSTLKAHVQFEDMLSSHNKVHVCFGKAKGTRAPHQHQQDNAFQTVEIFKVHLSGPFPDPQDLQSEGWVFPVPRFRLSLP